MPQMNSIRWAALVSWVALVAINTLVSGLLSIGIPWAINASSKLFGGTTIVPTDGFTTVLLFVVVFLAMLVIELALYFRGATNQLQQDLPKVVRTAIAEEVKSAIEQSFAASISGTLVTDFGSIRAIGSFLTDYFAALKRVPENSRTIAALLSQLKAKEFTDSIQSALSDGFEVSSPEGLLIANHLLQSSKSYIMIDQGIYDLNTYWTPAWHQFANKMRESVDIHKQWVMLLPRTEFEREWGTLKELWKYVIKHGFEFRFTDIDNVQNTVGFTVDSIIEFETIELIDNIAISWDTRGKGYRGAKRQFVKVLDLEASKKIGRFLQTTVQLSELIDKSEANRLTRDLNKATK